jgi:hypothetical protein
MKNLSITDFTWVKEVLCMHSKEIMQVTKVDSEKGVIHFVKYESDGITIHHKGFGKPEYLKPVLRTMSSMTPSEKQGFEDIILDPKRTSRGRVSQAAVEAQNYLQSLQVDGLGWIEAGLAIEKEHAKV